MGIPEFDYISRGGFLNIKLEDFMSSNDEDNYQKELLETYQNLDKETKENVLAYAHVALAAQENAIKALKNSEQRATA